jgi:hypothetical protein
MMIESGSETRYAFPADKVGKLLSRRVFRWPVGERIMTVEEQIYERPPADYYPPDKREGHYWLVWLAGDAHDRFYEGRSSPMTHCAYRPNVSEFEPEDNYMEAVGAVQMKFCDYWELPPSYIRDMVSESGVGMAGGHTTRTLQVVDEALADARDDDESWRDKPPLL